MPDLEKLTHDVIKILDEEQDFVIALTQQLVRIKSVNPNFLPNGHSSLEAEAQAVLQNIMAGLELETTRWEAAPNRPNLIGRRTGSGNGKSLILNGHIDVVPEGDPNNWKHDPYGAEIENGRMYGRGTYDMKGGVAAMVAAVRALGLAGVQLSGDVSLHTVVDEEAGGTVGTKSVIQKGYTADAALITEPTQGELITAEGGLSWLRVTFFGRSAHAGWRFAQIYPQGEDGDGTNGVNAIEKAVKFVGWLRELEREWALTKRHPLLPPGITTMNPGVILGGVGLDKDGLPIVTTNPAMIPDVCVVDIDFKYLPTVTFEEAREEFETYFAAFCQSDPWLKEQRPKLMWHLGNIDFPPISTPQDHELVRAVESARASLGLDTKLVGMVAVTDAAFYAGAGVPSVVYGPTGRGAHGDDEFVVVDSLTEAAKIYAGTMLRWCGVA